MSGSVNKVTLVGNLGRDPEIRAMQNGDKIVQLSIATSDRWKDKNSGEKKEKTEWHRIVIFNEGLVNVVKQYVKKGANVYIEGQLTTRKWKDESSGQDKYSTEIVLQGYNSSLTMLDIRWNDLDRLKEHTEAFTHAINSIPRLTQLHIDHYPVQNHNSDWFRLCKNLYDKVRTHQMARWLWPQNLDQSNDDPAPSDPASPSCPPTSANLLTLPDDIRQNILSYLRCDDLKDEPTNYDSPTLPQECMNQIVQSSSSTPTA